MVTIGQCFDPRSNNFDIIRLTAACLVVVSHSFSMLGHREPVAHWLGGYDTGGGWAVSIFFIVSGFLIAKSCMERSFFVYISSRIARIIPALAALLLFDVLIIGPLFTQHPISVYFSSLDTLKHLASVSVFYQATGLPGVFGDGVVNGTIWTLPIEFACYLVLPVLLFLGALRKWFIIIPLGLVAYLYASASQSGLHWANQGGEIFYGLPYYSTLKNSLFFMIGATMWVHRDHIPIASPLALLSISLLVLGAFGILKMTVFYIGLSYLTIYVSIARPWPIELHKSVGDLSYGIYLYGFPIQKSVIVSGLIKSLTPLSLTFVSLPIVLILAYASWWVIERPSLQWRKKRQTGSDFIPPLQAGP